MGYGSPGGFLDEADLHALVDGRIEGERRSAALRRLATSPSDRMRVEAWQGQNDLLHSAFADVEREPIPAILDLTAKARLHCIPANDAPILGPGIGASDPSTGRGRIAAIAATITVIAVGLGGSWLLLDSARPEQQATISIYDNTIKAGLIRRSGEALATTLGTAAVDRLPTVDIPDLHGAGFSFAGAMTASDPATILFHYRKGPDRIVVSVARESASESLPASLTASGAGYTWRSRDNAFAIVGTPKSKLLREIALTLQKEAGLQ